MGTRIYPVVLFLFFFTTTIKAQIIKPISLNSNWEVWYDKIPVSGNLQVGLMSDASNEKISTPNFFYCYLPEKHKDFLYAEISSQNGKYEAKLSYKITGLKAGLHQFQLPTAYVDKLKAFQTYQIALLLRGRNNSTDIEEELYFGKWLEKTSADVLNVFLNTENPTFISYETTNSEKKEVACQKIEDINAVAFNCLCKLDVKEIKGAKNINILHRIRKGPVARLASYPFNIKI
jgi:hypothetical protein